MAPIEVNADNRDVVADRLFPPKPDRPSWKLNVGVHVRLGSVRDVFIKGYVGNWTGEIFKIVDRFPTHPVTYGVSDLNDESVQGKFYEQELQKVYKPEFFAVERILKTRKRDGRTEYFVKWRDYPDSFNSWTSDITTI